MHVLRMLLMVPVLQPVREDQDCANAVYVTGGPCVTAGERGPGMCMYCVYYWWTMLQPVRDDQDCACTAYITGGPCYSQ